MHKWKYLRAILEGGRISAINGADIAYAEQQEIKDAFEELGSEGWELVAVTGHNQYDTAYFKRSKAEKPPTLPPIRN